MGQQGDLRLDPDRNLALELVRATEAAAMLYNGEQLGTGVDPQVDVAVDPVDGTTLTARSLPNAIAVVALAERGTVRAPIAPQRPERRAALDAGYEVDRVLTLDDLVRR
jgi:fructose-1,6-bisphosphatase II